MMKRYASAILFPILLILFGCSSGEPPKPLAEIPYVDTGVDPETWVKIPAGEFYSGQHMHVVDVDYDYEIMLTDVTNEQYARFLNSAVADGKLKVSGDEITVYYPGEPFDGYNHEIEITAGDKPVMNLTEPGNRIRYVDGKFTVIKGFENHPVVNVTWFGANAYAEYYGWRLPTEIEWEKAARGNDGRVYPWGNEIARNQANFYSSQNVIMKIFGHSNLTTPVGYYNGRKYGDYQTVEGRSFYGLYDMAGNVWQWCGDDYPHMHLRYMRGGSMMNYEYNLRTWARNSAGPDYYAINIGFRCARDVKPAENEETEK